MNSINSAERFVASVEIVYAKTVELYQTVHEFSSNPRLLQRKLSCLYRENVLAKAVTFLESTQFSEKEIRAISQECSDMWCRVTEPALSLLIDANSSLKKDIEELSDIMVQMTDVVQTARETAQAIVAIPTELQSTHITASSSSNSSSTSVTSVSAGTLSQGEVTHEFMRLLRHKESRALQVRVLCGVAERIANAVVTYSQSKEVQGNMARKVAELQDGLLKITQQFPEKVQQAYYAKWTSLVQNLISFCDELKHEMSHKIVKLVYRTERSTTASASSSALSSASAPIISSESMEDDLNLRDKKRLKKEEEKKS